MVSNAIQYSETRDLQLESVSALYHANGWSAAEKPELLRRDPDDLYNRYRSTVEIGFVILDEKGEETNWNAIEVTLPVTANPDKQWKFPSTGDVMDAVLKECNRRGEGMLKINQERIATLKKIRGY